ncbi:MAG TPA: sugar transferase [Verrucomicrobiae bacterium]|nr:sugar transferase [Verrucomicrobiae bacterium]
MSAGNTNYEPTVVASPSGTLVAERAAAAAVRQGLPLWKRTLDALVLLVALPVWLPLALLVALVVRLGSRGPIFFRQPRVGQNGRTFTCFKFRTMQVNAEQGSHQDHVKALIRSQAPMVKLDAGRDGRLIRGGSWIRVSGLDELPQIINILRGEMSLVGPRPCIPYEYEMYEPWQRQRCTAPPGLTGLWQVSGKNRTTFTQMVQLDIEYARRMSPGLDLLILLRTPLAIVQQVCDLRAAKRAAKRAGNPPKSASKIPTGVATAVSTQSGE